MSLLFFFLLFLSFLATKTYLLSIHMFDTGMTTVQKVWGNDIRDRLCSTYPQKKKKFFLNFLRICHEKSGLFCVAMVIISAVGRSREDRLRIYPMYNT